MPRLSEYSLRAFVEADLEQVLLWRNSDRVRQHMYSDHLISWEEHVNWFHRMRNDHTHECLIFEYQNRPVGVVSFSNIDTKHMRCTWGFYLGETDIPKGSGLAMGLLGLSYGFETIGSRKICGEVLASNDASIRFHQKLGFVQEGHFVNHIYKNGHFEDVLSFACFSEDWGKHRENIMQRYFVEEK
ncbi:UDP-4-amino-4,6-dideoxy-N-acetyl-beta-L-altrosamine N-acetyltransferase [Brevibacillus sp. H7]|uniref:UDP-4-amino-4, 6-dideoxy-N-acetyl-beta-L-altrosamine N-acetyltransferase n=1 Tax=Brevibacillus sp. H7 TaxID=3349138 RepID=UPI00380620F2